MGHVQPIYWVCFLAAVLTLVCLDLVFVHGKSGAFTFRQSLLWTFLWGLVAAAFGGIVWAWLGTVAAIEFATGYLIEWSLSVDNLVVFVAIFESFRVSPEHQRRILFFGIIGAIAMRLAFVLLGAEMIVRAEWVMALFGIFLVYSGATLAWLGKKNVPPEEMRLIRWARSLFPLAFSDHEGKFIVREKGGWHATRLLLVLVLVETTDILFAVDSVPAVFGVVNHASPHFRFVVFTSNVCAVLGLRALYFVIAGIIARVVALRKGLSTILVFVGGKMLAEYALPRLEIVRLAPGEHLFSPWVTLLVILALLAAAGLSSLRKQTPGGTE